MNAKQGSISDEEALLLLELMAGVDAAQARLNRVVRALAEKHGLEGGQGNTVFNFANRTIMQITQPEEEGNDDRPNG